MVFSQMALLALSLGAGGDVVLYDFTATWCGPCRQMAPVVHQLQAAGYPVEPVDIDQHPELASRYQVSGVPCFVLVAKGQEVDRIVGATSADNLVAMMARAGVQPAAGQGGERGDGASRIVRGQDTGGEPQRGGLLRGALDRVRGGLRALTGSRGGDTDDRTAMTQPALAEAPRFDPSSLQGTSSEGAVEPPSVAPPQVELPAVSAPPTGPPDVPPAVVVPPTATVAHEPSQVAPAAGEPQQAEADLATRAMAASVRLRIDDGDGHSVGSGTIVDAREGEALVLTCGHIFRDSGGKGAITVDLFAPQRREDLPGQLIAYDLELDLGLVSFRPPSEVTVVPVSPPDYSVKVGDAVVTVGCNHGSDPTVQESRVLSLDKFLGPPNLQVAGQPVQGRSGGGVFSADGYVIGVCNAADPADNQGLYAAAGAIYTALDQANLSDIYERPATGAGDVQLASASEPTTRGRPPRVALPTGRTPGLFAVLPSPHAAARASSPAEPVAHLTPGHAAALAAVGESGSGAEVVCVVRSRNDPQGKSQIIMLENASPEFLAQLARERRAQPAPQLTSMHSPRPASTARVAQGRAVPRQAVPTTTWRLVPQQQR